MILLQNILFLDIETVPQYSCYEQAPENMQLLWEKKAATLKNKLELDTTSDLYQQAGIYAEFGKIVCISVGFFHEDDIRIKSFFDEDEKTLLLNFADLLNNHFNKSKNKLCAHNGKEFDFPYIARRMLINGIRVPELLNLSGKKPWENPHIDTLDLWKFGDHKHYTSLELLATVFNIPTPKSNINGSMVSNIYWDKKDINTIVSYCENDVRTVFLLYKKIKNL